MNKRSHGLSAGRLSMLALGTVIGGSFFLGSSVAIRAAGPGVLLAFLLGGVLVYYILFALSEMTAASPDAGSFRSFAATAFGEGAGFVTGWVYWTGMVLAMSSEATAVSILLTRFFPNLPVTLLGGGIIVLVTLLNLLGADRLSRLESGLAAIKLLALVSFIVMALLLILGLFPGEPAVGLGALKDEPFLPGGVAGLAGSMLIVLFSYAGFEIIGLAASEAKQPEKTIPRAIRYTVTALVALYVLSVAVLLPLIPTDRLGEDDSPIVAALSLHGIGWAGTALSAVLITAILSTMLAAMFGLGRIMRSLAEEKLAPRWLRGPEDVPYRGILASGISMLAALGLGLVMPGIYLFLISAGGFALLFTYAVIMATHIRLRRKQRLPLNGNRRRRGFPYASLITLLILIASLLSMPFVPGQSAGLAAGCAMVVFYTVCYAVVYFYRKASKPRRRLPRYRRELVSAELSEELDGQPSDVKKPPAREESPPK